MLQFTSASVQILLIITMSTLFPAVSASQGVPQKGEKLPAFILKTPAAEKDQHYLGIGPSPTFSFEDINTKLVMIETVGVYCPQCHIQLPKINNMFRIIAKDPALKEQFKIMAIAVGANPTEVAYLKKQLKIAYPVITDPQFEVHKVLGEPRTPFNMIVRHDRKILFTHLGSLTNTDTLLNQIRSFAKQSP
jgi:hypothetical protein